MCDHLHETTSRFDAGAKVLTFLLVCRICGIERIIEEVDYEPRPVWTARRIRATSPGLGSLPPLEAVPSCRDGAP